MWAEGRLMCGREGRLMCGREGRLMCGRRVGRCVGGG